MELYIVGYAFLYMLSTVGSLVEPPLGALILHLIAPEALFVHVKDGYMLKATNSRWSFCRYVELNQIFER